MWVEEGASRTDVAGVDGGREEAPPQVLSPDGIGAARPRFLARRVADGGSRHPHPSTRLRMAMGGWSRMAGVLGSRLRGNDGVSAGMTG